MKQAYSLFYVRTFFLIFCCVYANVAISQTLLPELGEGKTITEIIQVIANNNQPDPGLIRVSLHNGAVFEGVVTTFAREKSTLSIKGDGNQTTLINLSAIASLTILDAGSALVALRGNKIYREETDSVQSRLSLMRRVSTFNEEDAPNILLQVSESELGDEGCRFYVSRLLLSLIHI